jgi:hypothetical protein
MDSGFGAIFLAITVEIIGVIFAALKRKVGGNARSDSAGRLVFVVGKTEDLDNKFGRGPGMRIVAPDGAEVEHLNKCNIGCTNVGTDAIKDFAFEISLPTARKYFLADFFGRRRPTLRQQRLRLPWMGRQMPTYVA